MSLVIGYGSTIAFELSGMTLPDDAQFKAHIRDAATSAGNLLATLTSADDEISVASVAGVPTVTVVVPGAKSAAWTVTEVYLDVVRIDVDPPDHLGWKARLQFIQPVTPVGEL